MMMGVHNCGAHTGDDAEGKYGGKNMQNRESAPPRTGALTSQSTNVLPAKLSRLITLCTTMMTGRKKRMRHTKRPHETMNRILRSHLVQTASRQARCF